MMSWRFLAASSWMIVTTLGFVVSILSLLMLMRFDVAALVGIGAAVIPVILARAILGDSGIAAMSAALYAFGCAAYLLYAAGPSRALLVLAWLGIASIMAGRELAKRLHVGTD